MSATPGDAAPYSEVALFGKDPTARIVDVLPLLDGAYAEQAHVRVYRRSSDGAHISAEDEPFFPFFFLSDIALLQGFPRERFQFQHLAGTNPYRYLVVVRSWAAYWDAVRHVERATDSRERRPEELYLINNPAQQYLMQAGRTCFKGMAFDDLHRLQLDIEVYSESGFPNAARPTDEIIIVSLHDNRGWHRVIDTRAISEKVLLQELVRVLRERDPDVIEGYNLFAFDLPYIRTRCERHGVPFAIGRDGSEPRSFPSSMRFAERTIEFPVLEIAGRHVVDVYFQVMAFDVFKRDLPGYGLKDVARYFGFAPEDRTYIAGAEIARTWRDDPDRVLAYALDDVIETERLARHLSGSAFYLTQMLPMPYGQVARTGPAAKIESLFVREYLRQRHSIPRSEWGSQVVGGYTDVFITGVVGPVVYADVESLYPSIMLNYDVKPRTDELHLFPDLLRRLTDLRFDAKRRMKAAGSEEVRGELDARQSSYKILINCFTPDTDIMTAEGLKPVGDVEPGELVYAIDPETFDVCYKPVVRAYRQDHYDGPIVRFENAFVDFAVTPNHRMLTEVAPAGREPSGYAWRKAEELFANKYRHRLPPNGPFTSGAHRSAITLKEACDRLDIAYKYDPEHDRIKDPGRQAKWIPNTYRLVDWLELAGWYVSEGSVYKSTRKDYGYTVRGESWRVNIGNKTPAERDEIRGLIDCMGLTTHESVNGFSIGNLLLARIFAEDFGCGSEHKKLPCWIWKLDGHILRNLLRTAYLGDDHKSCGRYSTKSRRLAEDFVRLAFHCGKRARITGHDSGCWRIAYYDRSRGVRPEVKQSHRWEEAYAGPLVCIEVADFHTVLAGRNGKLNWCGQSFYGQLGFSLAVFNDFAEADRVAATGQEILRQIIELIRTAGGQVIEVDTDGVLFVPPPDVQGEAAERAFLDRLNTEMPTGIRIGFDGRFRRMISYKKKNYALQTYDGTLKFKGSSLVSRSIERFGRRFVRAAIERLLEEDIQGLHDLYLDTRDRILAHDWKSARSFSRTETLKDTVEQYQADVEAGKRTRAAAYELAIRKADATGLPPRKGDRISYYVTGSSATVTTYDSSRLADDWDPAQPDENTAYYLKRLDEFARKFEPFFTEHDFRLIFSPEDLFGFSPAGIRILRHERRPGEVEDEVPF